MSSEVIKPAHDPGGAGGTEARGGALGALSLKLRLTD
jgi:hypothetical protein